MAARDGEPEEAATRDGEPEEVAARAGSKERGREPHLPFFSVFSPVRPAEPQSAPLRLGSPSFALDRPEPPRLARLVLPGTG